MKILVITRGMEYLSGSMLYNYELALQLSRLGHSVWLLAKWEPFIGRGDVLRANLRQNGVVCIEPQEYLGMPSSIDLIIASQPHWYKEIIDNFKCKKISVVHSEYDPETPTPGFDHYVCIRPEVQDHIVKEHGIPKRKTTVIYNGIDRQRFKKVPPPANGFYKTVVPCTLDTLREKFLNHLIENATSDDRVFIYGNDFGANLLSNPYAYIYPETFDVQEIMKTADMVAGILLGRVNLEARSMGIMSSIYDPVTLKRDFYFPAEEEFDRMHNIVNVTNEILKL